MMRMYVMIIFFLQIWANLFAYGLASPNCDCGQRAELIGQFRIANSKLAKPNSFPWSVYFSHSRGNYWCGGALISDRWVLTAAHCVNDLVDRPEVISAIIGFNDIDKPTPDELLKVEKIIVHENYSYTAPDVHAFDDIALMKLVNPVEFGDNIKTACLPKRNMIAFNDIHFAGWGKLSDDPYERKQRKLRKAVFKYVDDGTCSKMYHKEIRGQMMTLVDKRNLCATSEKSAFCSGDSGGPAIAFKDGFAYAVGVASWGGPCDGYPKHPMVFTRVTSFLDWIAKHTNNEVCLN